MSLIDTAVEQIIAEDLRAAAALMAAAFADDQPRDDHGRWTSGDIVHHGSTKDFDRFDTEKVGSTTDEGWLGKGTYFSTDKRVSHYYPLAYETKVTLDHPLKISLKDFKTNKQDVVREAVGLPKTASVDELTKELVKRGHDGVVLDMSPSGYMHTEVMAINNHSMSISRKYETGNTKMWDDRAFGRPDKYRKLEAFSDTIFRVSAAFVEEEHPRDEEGKFTDSGGGKGKKAPKAPPVPKDLKDKAYQMVKSGETFKATAKKLGMTPGQVAGHVWKVDQKKKELAELVKKNPPATVTPVTPPPAVTPVTPPPAVTPPVATPSVTTSPVTVSSSTPWTSLTKDQKLAVATSSGYTWKEKTSGPLAGQYAWFDKNGTQVSSPFAAKDAHREALDTLHNGKGIEAAPVASHTPGWPISNDTVRSVGSNYPNTVTQSAKMWLDKLPSTEKDALAYYTGSGYAGLNERLRKGSWTEADHNKIDKIDSALAKSHQPPPPELVWRGVRVGEATEFSKTWNNNDIVELRGYQSTSIDPNFASGWASTGILYEIKPSRGGYIQPISHHPSESEYLLPHNTRYRVRGKATVNLKGHTREVIQLEMLK
jgi:hypothetical protein